MKVKNHVEFVSMAYAGGVSGSLWYDSTQLAMSAFAAGIQQQFVGVIFTYWAATAIANTTTETSLLNVGGPGGFVGTKTLPANFWTIGKQVRIKLKGTIGFTGTAVTATIKVYLGSTLIATGVNAVGAAANAQTWEMEIVLMATSVGAAGNIRGTGSGTWERSTTGAVNSWTFTTSNPAVDQTATKLLDVTVTWSAANASNTIKVDEASYEVLN